MDGLYSHDVEEHYKILSPVGKGGMGTVFKAKHKELERFAAIKMLHRDLARTRVQRERFFREAKTSANLQHPNVVEVYEVGYCREVPSIVMEFLEGQTLFEKFQSGVTLMEGLDYLVQVTEALVYAHKASVIHRDLKPANVIITKEGVAKVADWGLAKTTTDETGLTKTGMIVGTPSYMAPEQVLGEKPGPYTDLYALGVMLYQLCAKKTPFEGAIAEVLSSKMKRSAPSLSLCGRALPEDLVKLTDTLLERDVSKRPNSARAVLETLRTIEKAFRSKSASSSARTQSVKPAPRRGETLVTASQLDINAQSKSAHSSHLLFLIIGLAIGAVATFLLIGSQNEPLPPLVSAARLANFDKIILSLSRQPQLAKLELQLTATDGKVENKDLEVVHKNLQASLTLPVQLDRYIFEPGKLVIYVEEGSISYKQSFSLDPGVLINDLFKPIDSLSGKTLHNLINDVMKMSSRLKTMRQGDDVEEKDRLRQLSLTLKQRLAAEDFSEVYCQRLERTLPKLLAVEPSIGTVLDRRLMPLRHIERAFSDHICPELPWKFCVTKAMGFEFGEGSLPAMDSSWRPLWFTSFKEQTTNPKSPEPNNPKWYTYLWLDEWAKVRKYQSPSLASEGAFQSAVTAIIQMELLEPDEVRPYADSLQTLKVIRARFKVPQGAAWPPKEALIGFSIKLFGPETLISVRVNGGPSVLVTNAGNHEAKSEYGSDKNTWFTMPISSKLLKIGLNSIYVEPLPAPGPDKLIPICLKECKLWIR